MGDSMEDFFQYFTICGKGDEGEFYIIQKTKPFMYYTPTDFKIPSRTGPSRLSSFSILSPSAVFRRECLALGKFLHNPSAIWKARF